MLLTSHIYRKEITLLVFELESVYSSVLSDGIEAANFCFVSASVFSVAISPQSPSQSVK
jgi:hypothetical protein